MKSPFSSAVRRRVRLTAATVLGVTAASLAVAGPANAAPTGPWADFTLCPTSNPAVEQCLFSNTTSGSFKLGNADVPIGKAIKLQGGFSVNPSTGEAQWYNAQGGDTLQKVGLDVPGGLLGITPPSSIFNIPLLGLLFQALAQTNKVTATAELVGPVKFGLFPFLTGSEPALTLPIRVHLENPFLGDSCYIGSASKPMTLQLTTGTTAPPAPNTPLTGAPGDLQFTEGGNLITGTGYKLVDNSFAAPAATECGPWGFQWIVTPIVNAKEGLPAAAGKNAAIMQGSLKIGNAGAVKASSN